MVKGLEIFKEHQALQNKLDQMDEDAIFFNIECVRKNALRVWTEFSLFFSLQCVKMSECHLNFCIDSLR